MGSRPGPIQNITEPQPQEALSKAPSQKMILTDRTATPRVRDMETAYSDMTWDHADESEESDAAKQLPAPCLSQYTPPGPVLRRKRTRMAMSSNMPPRETSRSYELPDSLPVDVKNILSIVRNLQQENSEKTALQKELNETREILQQKATELETVRKSWKRAASQLNQLQSQTMNQYQLTDSDLTSSLTKLRYNIRAISVYWEDELLMPLDNLLNYMHGGPGYGEIMSAITMQSFLWRLLIGEIFNKFRWLPETGEAIAKTYEVLQPVSLSKLGGESTTLPEIEQKIQTWKATTSSLALELIKDQGEEHHRMAMESYARGLCKQVLDATSSMLQEVDVDNRRPVLLPEIIEGAMALDQEICRQAARVDWVFPPPSQDLPSFDPEYMEVELGEAPAKHGQLVYAVLVPALKKRGKFTGEDFENEYFLSKMVVTCFPLYPRPACEGGESVNPSSTE